MFGISEKSYRLLLSALEDFPEIEKAGIYGSRALGNYKKGSDIDLVIFGSKISPTILSKLAVKLEQELPIPYFFDITHYETISNSALREHVDTVGKMFYQRN